MPETIEQCVLEAAGAVAALRFSSLASSEANIDAENSGDSSLNVNVGEKVSVLQFYLNIKIRGSHGKRKRIKIKCILMKIFIVQRKHDGGPELEVILLRANFEEFIRFLRHKVKLIV